MEEKTLGVVLKVIKYNDTTNIVDLYAECLGRCSVAVNIPKSSKARVKSNLFQPLAILDLNLSRSKKGGLYRVKDAKPHLAFQSIPYNPYKSAIAFFIAEFIYYAVKEEGESGSLFSYLMNSIQWLDESQNSYANFHLVFMMRLSLFLGLYPNIDNYTEGDYFDLLNASFISYKPTLHNNYLEPLGASHIVQLMRMNYETMYLFKLNRHDRNEILDVLSDFYKIHIPNFPELKSLDVLKELFD